MDNVHVVIRVRPLINTEQSSDEIVHWKVQENTICQLDGDSQRKAYAFDRVFSPSSTSAEIFDEVAQPILDAVMNGYNGTIFAYGQTSSGKTHTMMGTNTDSGVIPRTAKALFEAIERMPLRKFLLRVSYMEIYNEKVIDLLKLDKKHLNVREDGNGKTFVENLSEEFVGNCEDLLEIMKKGEMNRSYGTTHANENSSRSHTIFTLTVESAANQEDGEEAVMVSQLNLVDLAGSERASQSRSSGERFREGCAINTSLFTLRKVIKSLSQADGQFVCFRDSKLTRILQSSLGGNAKTSIICTVTPAMIDETHSTLQFASTAKTIKNQPTINEVLSDEAMLKRYTKEIQLLQKKLDSQNETEKDQEFKKMELKLQETSEKNQLLERQLVKLTERIVTSSLNSSPRDAIVKSNQNYRRLTWGGPRLQMMLPQIMSPNIPPAPLSALKSCRTGYSDCKAVDEEEIFIPGKKVRFESRFSDECLVITNEVECQTDLSDSATPHSAELEDLKGRVETLSAENSKLSKKITVLYYDLRSERESRILAEKRQNVDNTFQFLQEENSVQDEEITNLKDRMENLIKSSQESEALLMDVNRKQAQENVEMRNTIDQLEQKLRDASKVFLAEHLESQKTLQNQLDAAQKNIKKLDTELKDAEIQYEHNQKHADVVKNELRQQLQLAYDRIDYLEQHNACLDVSKVQVCGKERSMHELTLGEKEFSKLFKTLPTTPSKQASGGIDYDSEMQIVQMEFELREAAHLESIAVKDVRIEELARQVEEASKQHSEFLRETEDLKASVASAREKEEDLVAELEKARLNSQAQVQEMDMKNWEARQREMLVKIASLEEEISNYKSASNVSHQPELTAGDYPDMRDKIDSLLRIVEEFCQKEKSFVAEHPFGEDVDFRKHLKDSQAYQEELQRKIEDLRRMVLHLRQKEQHVLGELEGLKAELQDRRSFGDESTRTQKDAEETIVLQSDRIAEMNRVIQDMKQKEKNLVEKLEDLEDHIRKEASNVSRDVEGELIEMRKKAERLEADIIEYKQREEEAALSRKDSCSTCGPQHHRDACTETVPAVTREPSHADMTNELEQLRAKVAEYETSMKDNKEKEAHLLREIEQLKDELLRESEHSSRMLRDKIDEFERFKVEHRNKVQDYECMRENYRAKVEEFDTCQVERNNKIEELERLKSERINMLKEVEALKSDHSSRLAEFSAEIKDLKLQLANYEIATSDARQKVSQAEAKREEMERELREYESKVLEEKQMESEMTAEIKTLQEDLKRLRDEAAEEASMLTRAKQRLSELEQKNVEMEEDIAKYAQNRDSHLEELKTLRRELELHRDCENTIKELQTEAAQSLHREKQLRHYTQTLESDAKSKSDGSFNYRELMDELNGIREREVRLRDAVKEKEAEIKDAQKQARRYEENVDTLQQQVYDLKNKHDMLQTNLLEMEEQEASVESEKKRLAKLQSDFEQKELNMRQAVENAEMRASELQQECDEAKERHRMHSREAGSSVGVQCDLLTSSVQVETVWTQVHRSWLAEKEPEVATPVADVAPGTDRATQCNIAENSNLLKDGVEGTNTLWSFTFSRGIQCELITEGSNSQRHHNEDSSVPLPLSLETRTNVNTPQTREDEHLQLKVELDNYKMQNANLVKDYREVRGTFHELTESKRTLQKKLSSLEENLAHTNGKCEKLKTEIRRLNSMKNASILPDSGSQMHQSGESGNSPDVRHSGSSLIMRDNVEVLRAKHDQLQEKYEKLKKLFMKQTTCMQRTKRVVEESPPSHRIPATSNSSPAVKISKISKILEEAEPRQEIVERKPSEKTPRHKSPERKVPLSPKCTNVGLPYSGGLQTRETPKCTLALLSSMKRDDATRGAEIKRLLGRDRNVVSPQKDGEDDCKVS